MAKIWILFVGLCLSMWRVECLENGLARTPPMGWNAWVRFQCYTDCKAEPDNCVSDKLIRNITDVIASEGYKEAGYQYVNLDDCWLERERDSNGRLVPDRQRFPYGMRALADYVHSKGLKFGIYQDYGTKTCAGFPGSLGHLKIDAQTFAEWGADYVKFDGCNASPKDMAKGYTEFGRHLKETGRPIIYSCEWPLYERGGGIKQNYTAIAEVCNLWRNFNDVDDAWRSVLSILDHYADNQDTYVPHAGPGHWNDPDMLVVGNFGLSYDQSKAQMALWAVLAAPLLMSADLRAIRAEHKAILQNKKIIRVNQDPLGIQGRRIYKKDGIEIWTRPISPKHNTHYSYALAFLNRREWGCAAPFSITLRELKLENPGGYVIEDLYTDEKYGVVTPEKKITVRINPVGVVLLRADVRPETLFHDAS